MELPYIKITEVVGVYPGGETCMYKEERNLYYNEHIFFSSGKKSY